MQGKICLIFMWISCLKYVIGNGTLSYRLIKFDCLILNGKIQFVAVKFVSLYVTSNTIRIYIVLMCALWKKDLFSHIYLPYYGHYHIHDMISRAERNSWKEKKWTRFVLPDCFMMLRLYIFLCILIYIVPHIEILTCMQQQTVCKKASLISNISRRKNWSYSSFSINLVRPCVFFSLRPTAGTNERPALHHNYPS